MASETRVEQADERGRFVPAAFGTEQGPRRDAGGGDDAGARRRRPLQASHVARPAHRLSRLGAALRQALALEQARGTAFLFIPVFLAAGRQPIS